MGWQERRVLIPVMYGEVWNTRRRLGERWPTPDPVDSVRFAITEAAEVVDARLRRNAKWQRNHDHESTVDEELADTIIMLATALGPEYDEDLFGRAEQVVSVLAITGDIDELPGLVAAPMLWRSKKETFRIRVAVALIVAVGLLEEPTVVLRRLTQLRAKWGQAATQPPSVPVSVPPPAEAVQSEVQIVPPGRDGAVNLTPEAILLFERTVNGQRAKGIAKYGAPLTDKTAFPAWQYTLEEFADLGVYLTRLKKDWEALLKHDTQQMELRRIAEAESEALQIKLDETQAKLVAAERAADGWRGDWEKLYWSKVPGGLNPTDGSLERMREAPTYTTGNLALLGLIRSHQTFAPLELYTGDGYGPRKGELGYLGLWNMRIVQVATTVATTDD